jgi:hypothetical protein
VELGKTLAPGILDALSGQGSVDESLAPLLERINSRR